ncbi:hypothetical protein D3C75_681380 [compost metagenome]
MNNRFKGEHICELISGDILPGFNADRHQSAVLEADNGNEHPNTDSNSMLQAVRNGGKQNLPDLGDCKQDEDNTGNKYSSQTHLPGEFMIGGCRRQNHGCKVCIKAHTRRQSYREIDKQSHGNGENPRSQSSSQEYGIPAHVDAAKSGQCAGINRQNIRHCHKSGQTGHNLCAHCGAVFFQLEKAVQIVLPLRCVCCLKATKSRHLGRHRPEKKRCFPKRRIKIRRIWEALLFLIVARSLR